MEIKNVNMSALVAATKFAANDKGRPLLNGVAVFANDFAFATNSYIAGIFGRPKEAPHDLAKRAREMMLAHKEDRDANPCLVIGAKDIVAASKLRNRADRWPAWDIVQVDDDHVRFNYGSGDPTGVSVVSQSLIVPLIKGEFPMLNNYMPFDPPQGTVYSTSFGAQYLKAICDAAVALTGDRSTHVTLLGRWGAHGIYESLRPQYWYVSNDSGSMLAVQMPVRFEVSWGTEDSAAA